MCQIQHAKGTSYIKAKENTELKQKIEVLETFPTKNDHFIILLIGSLTK